MNLINSAYPATRGTSQVPRAEDGDANNTKPRTREIEAKNDQQQREQQRINPDSPTVDHRTGSSTAKDARADDRPPDTEVALLHEAERPPPEPPPLAGDVRVTQPAVTQPTSWIRDPGSAVSRRPDPRRPYTTYLTRGGGLGFVWPCSHAAAVAAAAADGRRGAASGAGRRKQARPMRLGVRCEMDWTKASGEARTRRAGALAAAVAHLMASRAVAAARQGWAAACAPAAAAAEKAAAAARGGAAAAAVGAAVLSAFWAARSASLSAFFASHRCRHLVRPAVELGEPHDHRLIVRSFNGFGYLAPPGRTLRDEIRELADIKAAALRVRAAAGPALVEALRLAARAAAGACGAAGAAVAAAGPTVEGARAEARRLWWATPPGTKLAARRAAGGPGSTEGEELSEGGSCGDREQGL